MPKVPGEKNAKKVGKSLKEKRSAKRAKADAKRHAGETR